MSTYWTEESLRAACARGDARIIGPVGSIIHESTPVLSEKAFMAAIVRLATTHGWKVYHPFDSRKSAPGYPDLTMARSGEPVLFAELKIGSEKPTLEQEHWLTTLRHALHTEVYLWYPADWPVIAARLTRSPL